MLSIEYSKSNRATCKACKQKIEKDTLRMGIKAPAFQGDYDMVTWKHLECFSLGRKYLDLDPDTIEGISDLQKQDQQHVKEYILGGGKKSAKKSSAKKIKSDEDEKQDEEYNDKGENEEDEDDEKKKKNKKNKKQKPKKRKEKQEMVGYTQQQYKEYNDKLVELNKRTVEQLKSELRVNNQTTTGTKQELITRVADGLILGQIPKCLDCGGGKLRFDFMKGEYKCPGYMNDDEFIHCNKKYNMTDITRSEWINTTSN